MVLAKARSIAAHAATLEAALKRGADELQARLECQLRRRPRALENARRDYREFCFRLYRRIEQAGRDR